MDILGSHLLIKRILSHLAEIPRRQGYFISGIQKNDFLNCLVHTCLGSFYYISQ